MNCHYSHFFLTFRTDIIILTDKIQYVNTTTYYLAATWEYYSIVNNMLSTITVKYLWCINLHHSLESIIYEIYNVYWLIAKTKQYQKHNNYTCEQYYYKDNNYLPFELLTLYLFLFVYAAPNTNDLFQDVSRLYSLVLYNHQHY